jgi:hypothetical protein
MATDIAWLAASVIAGGVVTGILAGLFGIGGCAVIVPVLYEAFGLLGVPVSFACTRRSTNDIHRRSRRSALSDRAISRAPPRSC